MSYLRFLATSLGGALVSAGRCSVLAESISFEVYQVRHPKDAAATVSVTTG